MTKDLKWLRKAMVLGFSFFIAVLLVKPVGVSTQFSVISGMAHSLVDSKLISENPERASGYERSNAYYDRNEGQLAKNICLALFQVSYYYLEPEWLVGVPADI